MSIFNIQEETLTHELTKEALGTNHELVLFNDEVNTFDWVISCLILICKHTEEQAQQCALITHYKGKCAVKTGEFDKLKSMRQALCDKGLSAEII